MIDARYLKASDGTGAAILAHVSNPRLVGATTLKVDNVENWPPFFIATSGKLNQAGYITEASKKEFRGHLQSGDIIIDGFEPGFTDGGNTTDQVVIIKQTTGWANDISQGLLEVDSRWTDTFQNFVKNNTGIVTSVAGLTGAISNIVYYINGVQYSKNGIPNKTYTASKDTYVSIDTSKNVTYTEVANNAAAPALPADSVWVAKAVTNASSITSIAVLSHGVGGALGSNSVKAENIDFTTLHGYFETVESTVNNPNFKITIPSTGKYIVRANIFIYTASNVDSTVRLLANGTTIQQQTTYGVHSRWMFLQRELTLNAGTVITVTGGESAPSSGLQSISYDRVG